MSRAARLERWRRGARLCLGAAALAAASAGLAKAVRAPSFPPLGSGATVSATQAGTGEALLHGVPAEGGVTRDMPLASLWRAWIHHAPQVRRPLWCKALFVAYVAAVVCAGALLGSARAGFGAALLTPLFGLAAPSETLQIEYFSYAVIVLLVAGALAIRARRPDRRNAVLLGALVGASFLFRSTLVFFPLALGAWERRLAPRGSGRLLVVCLPYAFLLPWLLLNWRLSGRLVPFEDGRAATNIITGALGIVSTVTGDAMAAFAPEMSAPATGAALRWAAARIAAQPFVYASALWGRLIWIFSMHPALTLLGSLGISLSWRRRPVAAFALLAGYLVGVQVPMSINPNYLLPLWPLLCLIGMAGLVPEQGGLLEHWLEDSAKVLWGALAAILLAGAAAAAAAVLAYPARASRADALDRAIATSPGDDWALFHRGKARLREGAYDLAQADFAAAAAAAPGDPLPRLEEAWAAALAGRTEALDSLTPLEGPSNTDASQRLALYRAYAALRAGKHPEALRGLSSVFAAEPSRLPALARVASPRDRWALEKLRDVASDNFIWGLHEILSELPKSEAPKLAALLCEALPASAVARVQAARTLTAAGAYERSIEALEAAARLGLTQQHRQNAAYIAFEVAIGASGAGQKATTRRALALLDGGLASGISPQWLQTLESLRR